MDNKKSLFCEVTSKSSTYKLKDVRNNKYRIPIFCKSAEFFGKIGIMPFFFSNFSEFFGIIGVFFGINYQNAEFFSRQVKYR